LHQYLHNQRYNQRGGEGRRERIERKREEGEGEGGREERGERKEEVHLFA
jgi:hypothetical protein